MKVLFIHRSVGQNMLNDSNLRQNLSDVELFDINANTQVYTQADGSTIQSPLEIANGSTEPESMAVFFGEANSKGYEDYLSDFDCIIFKSCYTANAISSDASMESQMTAYKSILGYVQKHPKQQFIVCTSPPRKRFFTNRAALARAKKVQHGIIETFKNIPNADVLDIYGILANEQGTLAKKYCRFVFFDQHPNKQGSFVIAESFKQILGKV